MAQKFIVLTNGQLAENEAATTSTGVTDAGRVVALDSTGRLDPTVMPTGIGADTKAILASEALSAGDIVNVYNNAGTPNVRKADATNGRRAHGFVTASVANGANATVYFEGTITGKTGLAIENPVYLSANGATTQTAPTTATHIVQEIGIAVSTTEISFEPSRPVTLA